MSSTDVGADGYVTPLKSMIYETHEIYEELISVGFPNQVAGMIIAQILADAISNRADYGDDEADEEDDDDDDEPDDFSID